MVNRSVGRTRRRRTAREIAGIRTAILEVLSEQQPATCRGLFYALVARVAISKSENQYRSTVIRLATEMRKTGRLPYPWLADNTRWMRKPASWSSMQDALDATSRFYRRALWLEQDAYVEVWLEKDALAGVVYSVTETWDVPLMITRGYASLSFLHSAATVIEEVGKPVFLYYLGDHDPSGVDISRTVEAELRRMAPSAELTFTRLAVDPDQIRSMNLPTRPTKGGDTRAARFSDESVEVDAIPAPILRQLVEDAITRHVDPDRLGALLAVEQAEQESLAAISRELRRQTAGTC